MLWEETAVRDNLRNRQGRRVFYLPKGDILTNGARDWLRAEKVEILPSEQARPTEYVLLSGGFLREKPEHMTHLHGNVLVPKNHPRIAFRGAMDSLEAALLLAVSHTEGERRRELEQVLCYARKLLSWEVLEKPAEPVSLLGLSEEELHRRSHFPQDREGQPHFMPTGREGEALLLVNAARCAARSAELRGAEAFLREEGAERPDLLQGLNRLSSAIYLIMIRMKKEESG